MSFHDAMFAILVNLLFYIFSSRESQRVEQRVSLPVKITSLLPSFTGWLLAWFRNGCYLCSWNEAFVNKRKNSIMQPRSRVRAPCVVLWASFSPRIGSTYQNDCYGGGGCCLGTLAGQQVQEPVTAAWKGNANSLALGKPEAAPVGINELDAWC